MDRAKLIDSHRQARIGEIVPKFLATFEQLKEICLYEQNQRHYKGKQFKFQFKLTRFSRYIVDMTIDNKETVICVEHENNDGDNIRTIRSSDINRTYVDIYDDLELMDDTIIAYFSAKESGHI
jgi:hypothetical protein